MSLPACPNSIRMIILNPVPTNPDQAPAIKYNVPMSLWLQDHSHFNLKFSTYLKIYINFMAST